MSEQWLEMELARQLGPVAAPDLLWDRIHDPRPQPRAGSFRLWPVAAALLLVASGVVAWRIGTARDPAGEMERLAEREVASSPELDLRSEDPTEIRTWVKARTNIDIELPGSSAVRLLGARLIRLDGAPVAAIGYRVGDSAATLLVCRKRFGGSTARHVFAQAQSRALTWSMRGQLYTIASTSKDPQAACQLCHADPAPSGILKTTRRL